MSDGLADPALSAALAGYAEAPSAVTVGRLDAALCSALLYAPSVVAAGERRLALVALRADDGSSAMAVFSSIPALTAWRADARPVRVPGADVFAAAVEEGYLAVVIDPAGPQRVVVDGERLRSLAAGYRPVAGADDRLAARVVAGRPELRAPSRVNPALAAAVAAAVAAEPDVVAGWLLESRTGADWEPTLGLAVGATASLTAIAARLAAALEPYLDSAGLTVVVLDPAEQQVAAGLAAPPARRRW